MNAIDPVLMAKIETAVHSVLMTIIKTTVGAGIAPRSAMQLVRDRLDVIEMEYMEEAREATVDVPVSDVGDERAEEGQRMESLYPKEEDNSRPDGERGVRPPDANPRRTTGTDHQATYRTHGLRPDVGPNEPYS